MPDEYLLSRGYLASSRLNLQYYLWQNTAGYHLHPSIPKRKPDLKVAEVATGTGLWLSELSKTLPSTAQLDGFDISSDQFPHPNFLPDNVRLQVADAREDPAPSMCGVYDVVHLRLLLAVVENDDPGPFIRHCQKLLKPGGYFQWDEFDPWQFKVEPSSQPSPTPCLDQLVHIFRSTNPTGWIARLPDHFRSNGFEACATDSPQAPKYYRHVFLELWCLVTDEYAVTLEGQGALEKANGIKQLTHGAYSEIRSGADYTHLIRIAVGRKL